MKSTLSLNGAWQLIGAEEASANLAMPDALLPMDAIEIAAEVPGSIFKALETSAYLDGHTCRIEEQDTSWIEDYDWWYKCKFMIDEDFLKSKTIIDLNGLDSYSKIYLNGTEIGSDLDITDKVNYGTNTLAIVFERTDSSALNEFPGLLNGVQIVSLDVVSMKNIEIDTEISGNVANIWMNLEIVNHTDEEQQVKATLVLERGECRETIDVIEYIPSEGGYIESVIRIIDPELWQPNGVGEPAVYTCLAAIASENEVRDVAEKKVYVKEIEIINKEVFVNGNRLSYKGVIWEPGIYSSYLDINKYISFASSLGVNLIALDSKDLQTELADVCDEFGIVLCKKSDLPRAILLNIAAETLENDENVSLWESIADNVKAVRVSDNVCELLMDKFNYCIADSKMGLVDCELNVSPLYYYIKRALSPLMMHFVKSDDEVTLGIICEKEIDMSSIFVGVLSFDTCGLDVKEISLDEVWKCNPKDILTDPSRQCIIAMVNHGTEIIYKSVYFALDLDEMELPSPKLLTQRSQVDTNTHKMTISADGFANAVKISGIPAGAIASDNYFRLIPGELHEVVIDNITEEDAKKLTLSVIR